MRLLLPAVALGVLGCLDPDALSQRCNAAHPCAGDVECVDGWCDDDDGDGDDDDGAGEGEGEGEGEE